MTQIRRAVAEDAAGISSVLRGLYHREPADGGRMAQMLSDPRFVLILAELNGECVGYLYGYLLDRLDGTKLLLIYDVTVGSEHRRQGVGTELMRSAFFHGQQAGAAGCWLIADEENTTARSFYESLDPEEWSSVGFRWKLGERPS